MPTPSDRVTRSMAAALLNNPVFVKPEPASPETKDHAGIVASVNQDHPNGLFIAGKQFATLTQLIKSVAEASKVTSFSDANDAFKAVNEAVALPKLNKENTLVWIEEVGVLMDNTNSAAAFIDVDGWERTPTRNVWAICWKRILRESVPSEFVTSGHTPLSLLQLALLI